MDPALPHRDIREERQTQPAERAGATTSRPVDDLVRAVPRRCGVEVQGGGSEGGDEWAVDEGVCCCGSQGEADY